MEKMLSEGKPAAALPAHTPAAESDREFFERLARMAKRYSPHIDIHQDLESAELVFLNRVENLPNRARIKFFRPAGQKRMAAFFYKKSLLPHSRDRFAYGCMLFQPGGIGGEDIVACLDYAFSGFEIKRRPEGWMRGVPFEVPE